MKRRTALAVTAAAAVLVLAAFSASPDAPLASAAELRSAIAPNAIRYTVAPEGNKARYRVREQLMGRDLPNDAVGETTEVSGGITFDEKGAPVAGSSSIVVRVGSLKTDSDRRDNFVRGRTLQAAEFPTVELKPTAARGLPAAFITGTGAAAPVTFDLIGDLTVKGVTKPTTWKVQARREGNTVVGTATTKFTFTDFGITPPKVPIVLSVADTIGLEYDFVLNRER